MSNAKVTHIAEHKYQKGIARCKERRADAVKFVRLAIERLDRRAQRAARRVEAPTDELVISIRARPLCTALRLAARDAAGHPAQMTIDAAFTIAEHHRFEWRDIEPRDEGDVPFMSIADERAEEESPW